MNGIEWLVNPPRPQPIDLPTIRHKLEDEKQQPKGGRPKTLSDERFIDTLASDPGQWWPVSSVCNEMGISKDTARARLNALVEKGYVEAGESNRVRAYRVRCAA